MKILGTAQIKEADRQTIMNEPISSIDLMERAAMKFTEAFSNDYQSTSWVKHIFCGSGNNGGDGLAIARLLHLHGHSVKTYLLPGSPSADYSTNLERLIALKTIEIIELNESTPFPVLQETDVVIDAIFGSGLSRRLEGLFERVILHLNAAPAIKIAVDIPSGLLANRPSATVVFEADRVYTFQTPKLAFLMPENSRFVKRFRVLDIKLDPDFLDSAVTPFHFLEKKDIQTIFRPREKFGHKGSYGHALLIAGSANKMGAAILSAKAALRSGLGLLTVQVPGQGFHIIQTALPEAMCIAHSDLDFSPYRAIGIGPGIGTSADTHIMLRDTLQNYQSPVVLDADALNLLASDSELWHNVPKGSILTPHPGEFRRLVGAWQNDFERLELQRNLAIQYRVVVVLKGAHTGIALPDGNVYFNSTGNSGMATAGSGDVLTGILTALLAQGYTSEQAALMGVYLHGLAGNLCLDEQTKESMIASDIIQQLGKAFKLIRT
jgi:ADP-dependent NAD(P)H-hydrate dehydratase / NAD(P)H-hydrate epimerase